MIIDDATVIYICEDMTVPERFRLALPQGFRCFYCNRAMTYNRVRGRHITVEHLDTRRGRGYDHASNKVAACRRCNTLRGDLSLTHFIHIIKQLRGRLPEEHTHEFNVLKGNLHRMSCAMNGKPQRKRARIRLPARQEKWNLPSPVASA